MDLVRIKQLGMQNQNFQQTIRYNFFFIIQRTYGSLRSVRFQKEIVQWTSCSCGWKWNCGCSSELS